MVRASNRFAEPNSRRRVLQMDRRRKEDPGTAGHGRRRRDRSCPGSRRRRHGPSGPSGAVDRSRRGRARRIASCPVGIQRSLHLLPLCLTAMPHWVLNPRLARRADTVHSTLGTGARRRRPGHRGRPPRQPRRRRPETGSGPRGFPSISSNQTSLRPPAPDPHRMAWYRSNRVPRGTLAGARRGGRRGEGRGGSGRAGRYGWLRRGWSGGRG